MHTNDLRKLARETNDGVLRGPALGAADEIDRLRAEIERLTKDRELLRSCIRGNNVLREKAQKAIAERDEARSMLADAERDMRQRAADSCLGLMTAQSARKFILALPLKHMGQIHAECDCPHPDRCTSRCSAERNK